LAPCLHHVLQARHGEQRGEQQQHAGDGAGHRPVEQEDQAFAQALEHQQDGKRGQQDNLRKNVDGGEDSS
jgi:hypothetical protein